MSVKSERVLRDSVDWYERYFIDTKNTWVHEEIALGKAVREYIEDSAVITEKMPVIRDWCRQCGVHFDLKGHDPDIDGFCTKPCERDFKVVR